MPDDSPLLHFVRRVHTELQVKPPAACPCEASRTRREYVAGCKPTFCRLGHLGLVVQAEKQVHGGHRLAARCAVLCLHQQRRADLGLSCASAGLERCAEAKA